jgi:Ca2+-binding RTX toxin-like protein
MTNQTGTSGNDTLKGGGGDDLISGMAGNDKLYGGDGSDFLEGGAGADMLNGGSGIDVASYLNSSSGVAVSLLSGTGSAGDAEGDQLVGIEGVYGSRYDDKLWGDDNGNALWGDGGNDTLKGYGGNDSLFGHGDDDTLFGMDGNDVLRGGEGDDTINGGMGQDGLFGEAGADMFVWFSVSEAPFLSCPDGVLECSVDVIGDFNPAAGDVIDLSGIDANESAFAPGNQAFTFIGDAAFSGAPGELNYYYFGGSTYIQMQTGTSPDAEGIIRLPGIVTPQADWFVL